MGLDSVEIVMEVEDRFDISIPDEKAEQVRTPRHLVDLVVAKTQSRPPESPDGVLRSGRQRHTIRGAVPRELVESEVRGIIAAIIGIPRDRVTLDAELARDLGAD